MRPASPSGKPTKPMQHPSSANPKPASPPCSNRSGAPANPPAASDPHPPDPPEEAEAASSLSQRSDRPPPPPSSAPPSRLSSPISWSRLNDPRRAPNPPGVVHKLRCPGPVTKQKTSKKSKSHFQVCRSADFAANRAMCTSRGKNMLRRFVGLTGLSQARQVAAHSWFGGVAKMGLATTASEEDAAAQKQQNDMQDKETVESSVTEGFPDDAELSHTPTTFAVQTQKEYEYDLVVIGSGTSHTYTHTHIHTPPHTHTHTYTHTRNTHRNNASQNIETSKNVETFTAENLQQNLFFFLPAPHPPQPEGNTDTGDDGTQDLLGKSVLLLLQRRGSVWLLWMQRQTWEECVCTRGRFRPRRSVRQ